MADTQALDHFRKGRDILLGKRREIDHAIAEVERIISLLSSETWMVSEPLPPTPQAPQPGTIRATVLDLLRGDDRPFAVAEIFEAVNAAGHKTTDASLRSILNKMRARGEIANPARGKYQIAAADLFGRDEEVSGESGSTPARQPAH